MTTDTILVQRAASGDPEAFASIFEESFRCVHAFAARHSPSREAAETLTEAILAEVFGTLASYRGDVPFAAWLHAIARQTASRPRPRPERVAPKPPFARGSPR